MASVVAFVAPLAFCLSESIPVVLAGVGAVLLSKVLVPRRPLRWSTADMIGTMLALLIAGVLAGSMGLPSSAPSTAQIGVLVAGALAIETVLSRSVRSTLIGEGLARASCAVVFAVLMLKALRGGEPVWGLLAVMPVLAYYLDTRVLPSRESTPATARQLLRLPGLIAAHRTTVEDLVSFVEGLQPIIGSDLVWLHMSLPSGVVLVEASADGGVRREGWADGQRGFTRPAGGERPETIRREALPAGWRAGVHVPLLAPDGRDAGYLLLGWTRWSGWYLARWTVAGMLGGAVTSTGRALGAFWANVWAAHDLEGERSRLSAAIDQSGVAILALDPSGQVVVWNAAMADLTGTRTADALFRRPADLFTLTDENGSAVRLMDGVDGSAQLTTSADRSLWVEISSSAPDDVGTSGLLTAVFVDKSANRQLEYMRHLLLVSVHHELHGPLTSISGHAQLLGTASVGERETASLTAITDAVEMMHHVIADLVLILGEDPAARLTPAREPVDLPPLLRRTLQGVPSVTVRTTMLVPPEMIVLGDPVRLRQCLLLLLGNAEKYAPEGKITITLRKDGDHAVISVSDEGPGIPDDERRLVLRPYYRSADAQDLPGSGMGLHIAEVMMTAMQGRIELGSAPAGGLQADLWIPLAPTDHGDHGREEGDRPSGHGPPL
ncbi:PAS domain-containing sensor histidine kinase [Actinomadura darangshiensis]|nr:ATP-binding protein [Actinomadura darangshiensis]